MKEKLALALEIIGMAKTFKPIATQAVEAVKEFGPELDELLGGASNWIVKKRIEHVKMFEAAGFTREEAIYMTMDEWWGLRKKLNTNQNKK